MKARVKEDYKVIEKIEGKRFARPDYGVANVTDLVGLRVITLYRLDMLQVIEALLATIEADKSDYGAFVAGSVSEIKIYSTNPTGDAQDLPNRLKALFADHQLAADIEEKPSNYTSIHILALGRGKYRDGYRNIPVEIQVRTALEDVWGQIEHTLKYKRQRIEAREGGSRDEQRLETSLSHLGVLKTLIDGVSQYADQIKLQIDELEPGRRYGASKSAEEPNVRLARLPDLPPKVRSAIEAAVAEAKPVLEESVGNPTERIRALRSSLSQLEKLSATIAGLPDLQPKTLRESSYVVTMQRALVNFQLGNLLPEGEAQLQQALHLYLQAESDFPKRLVVTYRIARTLDGLGRRAQAIEKLRLLVDRLAIANEPMPKRHWIRSAAPRVLGVLLWEEAEATRGSQSGDRGVAAARVLELLQEAFAVTLTAHETRVREDPEDASSPSEKAKAANNLLYYLVEFIESGGTATEGMQEKDIRRYLQEMGAEDPETLEDYQFADTARRAYAHLGDRQREITAARRILTLTHGKENSDAYVRNAIRQSESVLDADKGS